MAIVELLAAGADINQPSDDVNISPLRAAIANGQTEVVKALIEHGANVSGKVTVARPWPSSCATNHAEPSAIFSFSPPAP